MAVKAMLPAALLVLSRIEKSTVSPAGAALVGVTRFAEFKLVRPAPVPEKAPVIWLAALVAMSGPANVFEPVKSWLASSRATLVERRASGRVPAAKLPALRLTMPAPSPQMVPKRLPYRLPYTLP